MTKEELESAVAERGVMIKAINIRPYMYSLPCSIGGGKEPFYTLNEMCCRGWTKDGRINWLLDTHNFFFAKPDQMVEVVPVPEWYYTPEYYAGVFERDAARMNKSRFRGR